jgi:hypothetical protein
MAAFPANNESVPYVAFGLCVFCAFNQSTQSAGGGDGGNVIGGGDGDGGAGGGEGGGGLGGGGGAKTSVVGFLSHLYVLAHNPKVKKVTKYVTAMMTLSLKMYRKRRKFFFLSE